MVALRRVDLSRVYPVPLGYSVPITDRDAGTDTVLYWHPPPECASVQRSFLVGVQI